MIWIHAMLFGILGVVWVLWKTKKIRLVFLKEARIRKLFFGLALGANALGLLLTVTSERDRVFSDIVKFSRAEGLTEEHRLIVHHGEEELELSVLVPAKESSEKEESEKSRASQPDTKDRLQAAIREYNEKRADPAYYYLPSDWEGEPLRWEKERDTSGSLLAGLGLLSAVLMAVLHQKEAEKEQQKREEALLRDYPDFVMKFTLLVKAGMTFRNAFRRMAADYGAHRKERPQEVYEAVCAACRELEGGVSEREVYEHFARRCGQIKYRTFASLLTQNLRKGSSGMLEILERESLAAWEERRRNARVQGEKAVTRLLGPMIAMMMLVMVLILVPAFLSFYGTM